MYKYINNGYIIGVGTGAGAGEPITEEEYNNILELINAKPTAPQGRYYALKSNLEWELKELPPIAENEEVEEEII